MASESEKVFHGGEDPEEENFKIFILDLFP
jgi:hypothetical protein